MMVFRISDLSMIKWRFGVSEKLVMFARLADLNPKAKTAAPAPRGRPQMPPGPQVTGLGRSPEPALLPRYAEGVGAEPNPQHDSGWHLLYPRTKGQGYCPKAAKPNRPGAAPESTVAKGGT